MKIEGFVNLKKLYCPNKKLTGLECRNCPKLENVLCQKNQLTDLVLANCPNINKLICNRNQLTNLKFLQTISSEKLEEINISNNNISISDLTLFQNFVNLKNLGLGNWDKEIIEQGIYNRFYGSLEPLKNLINLEELDLAGTDVDSGWEYLPESLQILYLFAKESPESKVKVIAKELRQYGEPTEDRDNDENFAVLLVKHRIQVFQKERIQFAEQQKQINYLELRVNELTILIKTQKDKIINTFWRLFPEKELVQQLIMAHFEFKRIEKQEKPSRQYRNKFNKLYYQLEAKIDEKTMNEIDVILKNCEKLIDEELELEAKLNEKQFLIESHKQITSQITDNQEAQRIIYSEEEKQEQQIVQYKRIRSNSLVTEIEKARLEGKVEVYRELALLPKTITTNQGVIIQGNRNKCGDYSVRDNTMTLVENPAEKYQAQTEIPPK